MSQSDFIAIRDEFIRRIERVDMRLQALEGKVATIEARQQNLEARGLVDKPPPDPAQNFNGPRVMRR